MKNIALLIILISCKGSVVEIQHPEPPCIPAEKKLQALIRLDSILYNMKKNRDFYIKARDAEAMYYFTRKNEYLKQYTLFSDSCNYYGERMKKVNN